MNILQAHNKIKEYSRTGEREKAWNLKVRFKIPFGDFLLMWTEKDRVRSQRQDWKYRLMRSKKLRMV